MTKPVAKVTDKQRCKINCRSVAILLCNCLSYVMAEVLIPSMGCQCCAILCTIPFPYSLNFWSSSDDGEQKTEEEESEEKESEEPSAAEPVRTPA